MSRTACCLGDPPSLNDRPTAAINTANRPVGKGQKECAQTEWYLGGVVHVSISMVGRGGDDAEAGVENVDAGDEGDPLAGRAMSFLAMASADVGELSALSFFDGLGDGDGAGDPGGTPSAAPPPAFPRPIKLLNAARHPPAFPPTPSFFASLLVIDSDRYKIAPLLTRFAVAACRQRHQRAKRSN